VHLLVQFPILFYITTATQIKSGKVGSGSMWDIINVVVLYQDLKTGSGLCK
jgi:hypothetical protein